MMIMFALLPVYDISLQKPKLPKIRNFKNNCNENSIKLDGPVIFLLTRDNRTSAKVTDNFHNTNMHDLHVIIL